VVQVPLVPDSNTVVPVVSTPNPVQTINYISYNILTAHPTLRMILK